MAYKIATWRWEDSNEEEYIADLYSKASNSSIVLFPSITNAILKSASNNEDYFDWLVSSSFEISFNIHNATEYNLLAVILEASESDIYIHFRNLTDTIFKGYILPELITIENTPYPYECKLTFSDGIGKLKDVFFDLTDFGEVPFYYRTNAINFIVQGLKKLDINDLYVNNTDWYLVTRPGYYYEGWNAVLDRDPFYDTMLNLSVLTDNFKKSVYDVLQEVCRLFHSRLIYSKGIYTWESIDIRLYSTYLTNVYKNWATYAIPLSVSATNNKIEIDHTNLKIYTGSNITFLPAVSQVDLKFTFDDEKLSMIAPYKWDWDHLATLTTIGAIVKGNSTKLHFEFEYYTEFTTTGQTDRGYVWLHFSFIIKVGSYYLKRELISFDNGVVVYGEVSWTLVASTFEVWSPDWLWNGGTDIILSNNWLFVIDTPEIIASGDLSVYVEYVEIDVSEVEGEWNAEIGITELINVFNYLRITGSTADELKTIIFKAINPVKNYKKLEFEGIHLDMGECNLPSQTFIEGDGFPTGWALPTVGTYRPIQEEFIHSVLELRESIRRVQNINLGWNAYEFIPFNYNLITYDSSDYLILNCEIDFRYAIGSFVILQLAKGVVDFEITDERTNINRFAGNGDISLYNNYTDGDLNTVNGIVPEIIETTADLTAQSNPTIPINGMIGNHFEGDYFKIYPDGRRASDLLRLTEDIEDKATSINNAAGVLSLNYPKYSTIIMNPRPAFVFEIISSPTTSGIVTKGILPDPAILSLNAMRRKVRVQNQGVDMKLVLIDDLDNYNDVAVDITTNSLIFSTDQSGNFITINFEPWEDILPT